MKTSIAIEIINTGTELLLGRVQNTHATWLGARLAASGWTVSRQITVADAGPAIQAAVREALARADVVLVTGGLGPTSDDLTRQLIADLLGRSLRRDPIILAGLQEFFSARHRTMPSTFPVQADVPDGASVLPNRHGTAPGLWLEVSPNGFRSDLAASVVILLPGPPRELRPMFDEEVLPRLREQFPLTEPYVSRTLKVACLGESAIEEQIAPALAELVHTGLELGYCARMGEVEVRLTAQGASALARVAAAEKMVRDQLGPAVFGGDADTLEGVVIGRLTARRQTVSVAESCTGGQIANRLTNVPGASAVFWGGLITYSNAAKQQWLGVRPETLAAHGAVSEATALEMALGARQRNGTDFALAVTGIAGPGGGTAAKPVGTVYLALATPEGSSVHQAFFPYDRETFKHAAAQQGLDLLRRALG